MRILSCSHIFPPAVDGGSQIVYNLSRTLEQTGHELLYVSSDCQSTDDFTTKYTKHFYSKDNYIRLSVVPWIYKIHRRLGIPIGPVFGLVDTIKTCLRIYRYRPELIIAGPLPTTIAIYTRIFQYLSQAKVLYVPCYHPNDKAFQNKLYLQMLKNYYLWVFTNSEKEALSPYCKDIFTHIPGINTVFSKKRMKTKSTHKRLLFLGNYSSHKNVPLLLEMMKYLPRDYTLACIGQSTLYFPIIQKIFHGLSISIQSRIKIIIKKYSPADEIKWLNKTDLLILPSVHESFGLVLAESMSQKTPVLAANLKSTSEFIKKSGGGYICTNLTPANMAKQVETIFSNRPMMSQKGIQGRQYVLENTNWVKITKEICDFLS